MIVLIALIGVLAAVMVNKKRKADKAYPPPPKSGWWFRFCKGMPDAPTPQGSGWTFAFPTDPANNVNAVLNYDRRTLSVGQTLTAACSVTGGGFTPWESPGSQALVSLFIQRRGDDLSGVGEFAGYRWYSEPKPLTAGPLTLSTALTSEAFTNVPGQHDADSFAAALANVESIGIVFGYEAGRAHGVYAMEPGAFVLERWAGPVE